jgi:hypothetical protein
MNLHAELVNLWLFVLAIAKTVLMCGYVAIPVALAECQSVHFNIARPLQFSDTWMACCEGCGAIYDLLPSGDTQTRNP